MKKKYLYMTQKMNITMIDVINILQKMVLILLYMIEKRIIMRII